MEKWNPTDAERTRFKEWVAGMKEMNRIVDEEARLLTVDQRLEEIAVLTCQLDAFPGPSGHDDRSIEAVRAQWNRLRAIHRERSGSAPIAGK